MSTTDNRIKTRSKNAAQRPGLLVPKQTRRPTEEVAAERKVKEDAKQAKEDAKNAGIKRVADFEQNQADLDAMERTPRAVMKPKPLVRTRSYADVLRSNDVDMADESAERGGTFEFKLAAVEAGQTTDDAMETEVEDSHPRKKNVGFSFPFLLCQLITYKSKAKSRNNKKKPGVRDANESSTFEFKPATVEAGQTIDDDVETAVQDSPSKKNVSISFLFSYVNLQFIRGRPNRRKARKNLEYGMRMCFIATTWLWLTRVLSKAAHSSPSRLLLKLVRQLTTLWKRWFRTHHRRRRTLVFFSFLLFVNLLIRGRPNRRKTRKNLGCGMPSRQSKIREKILNAN
jgi:hypothetical protein